jgi:putative ABC transport system permease protein
VADLEQAFRHALLRLFRRPGRSAAVVLILALGIGTSTAVYSVVRRVLLRPIPIPQLDRLAVAWEAERSRNDELIEVSLPYFLEWRAENHSFEDLAAFGSVSWSHEFKGPPRRETVPSSAVSASFFDTLRARPLLGRTFLSRDDEPGAGRVLVLSYGLWQRRFAGDPGVVGRAVLGSEQAFTIVGVMPKEFDFPQGAQMWTPVAAELESARRSMSPGAFRGLDVLYVVGRLKPGVALEWARADLAAISQRSSLADGLSATGWDARLVPLVDHYLGTSTRRALEALAVASGLVLLLSCANVTVLLLVQAIARRADLAVRQALGAGAVRAALPGVVEGGLLAFAGGVLGTLVARWAVGVVVAWGPPEMPGLRDVTIDSAALTFALVTTTVVAALVSLAPAAIASRLAIVPALKAGGRGGGTDRRAARLSSFLVASEVALSVVLLVGCGLMVQSLSRLLKIELGFVPDRSLSFSVGIDPGKYPETVDRRGICRAVAARLVGLPGVEAVGAVSLRPLELGPIGSDNWVFPEGLPLDLASVRDHSVKANWEVATPDYFRAVGTRILEGRSFSEHDSDEATKVVVVSRSLARRLWPGASALGKRLHTYGARADFKDGNFLDVEWQTVVGVVEDARYRGIQNPRPDVFLSYGQTAESAQFFVVRTTGDPLALAGAVREEVHAIDPDVQVDGLTTMAGLVDRALVPWRFTSALLAGFAVAGLVLTASGLFAVLHHLVSSRTREIAIRMALGAAPQRVRSFILGEGLRVTALGLLPGIGLSLVLARSLSTLLYEVGERDPGSYLAGAVFVGLVAVAACLLPARRAARVDPASALRSD